MCINFKSCLQSTSELLKASILPLSVLFVSVFILLLNHRYLDATSHFSVILEQISLALFAGSIFYFLTNTITSYQQKKIAKNFSLDQYKAIKIDIVRNLLSFLKKKRIDHHRLKENINNYAVVREYITDEDRHYISNNLDKVLVKETLYYFRQLRDVLIFLASYDFVKSNDELYRRVRFLHFWVEQFHHSFDLWYADNDNYEFSKSFDHAIGEFILGFSFTEGQKVMDDFHELLEKA